MSRRLDESLLQFFEVGKFNKKSNNDDYVVNLIKYKW